MFDCCAGDNDRLSETRAAMDKGDVDLSDAVLPVPDKVNAEWAADEANPDFKLVCLEKMRCIRFRDDLVV